MKTPSRPDKKPAQPAQPPLPEAFARLQEHLPLFLAGWQRRTRNELMSRARERLSQMTTKCFEAMREGMYAFKDNLLLFTEDELSFLASPLLPGTRYVFQHGVETVYLIEQPPHCRTLSFAGNFLEVCGGAPAGKDSFFLAFPHLLFVVMCSSGSYSFNLFFLQHPLSSLGDPLFLPCLPNAQNGSFCFKEDYETPAEAISLFWQSVFVGPCGDWDWESRPERDGRLASLSTWEKHSREDPGFVLSLDWVQCSESLSQFVSDVFTLPDIEAAKMKLKEAVDEAGATLLQAIEDVISTLRPSQAEKAALTQEMGAFLQSLAQSSGAPPMGK